MAALRDIPTDVIAVGDARAQSHTLARWIQHKPAPEHWAMLAGGGWLSLPTAIGLTVRPLPPGCACCVGNVVFRVTLMRLLRELRPDRLIVTLAADDHVERALELLRDEFVGVLTLAKVVR